MRACWLCLRCWMVSGFFGVSVVVALWANPVAVSSAVMANAVILFLMEFGIILSFSVIPECSLFTGYRHASYARVVSERAGLTQERHYQGTCGCSSQRLTLRDAATNGAGS